MSRVSSTPSPVVSRVTVRCSVGRAGGDEFPGALAVGTDAGADSGRAASLPGSLKLSDAMIVSARPGGWEMRAEDQQCVPAAEVAVFEPINRSKQARPTKHDIECFNTTTGKRESNLVGGGAGGGRLGG